jgi:hypothetical protein
LKGSAGKAFPEEIKTADQRIMSNFTKNVAENELDCRFPEKMVSQKA